MSFIGPKVKVQFEASAFDGVDTIENILMKNSLLL